MYDFHIHTTYSDGKNTIEEMTYAAKQMGLKKIAITDHIWRSSEWYEEYKHKIKDISSSELEVLVGFEAKALSTNGEIDATEYMCNSSDIRIGAIHRIPCGKEFNKYLTKEEIKADNLKAYNNWFETTKNIIKNIYIDIVAHPLMALDKYDLDANEDDIIFLFLLAKQYNKKLEISSRYKKSNKLLLDALSRTPSFLNHISYGSDAHSVVELQKAYQ